MSRAAGFSFATMMVSAQRRHAARVVAEEAVRVSVPAPPVVQPRRDEVPVQRPVQPAPWLQLA